MRHAVTCFLTALFLAGWLVWPVAAQAVSAAPVGRLIHAQGQVEVFRSEGADWLNAHSGQDIFAGEALRTGPDSVASVLCVDESQIKLHENTVILFKDAAPSSRLVRAAFVPAVLEGRSSRYQVRQGEVWLRNSNEKFRFEMETPALTAAVRGTEFILRVDADGFTSLALLHGSLVVYNPYGEIFLSPGELGTARPGQTPTRHVLVSPEDAVQWTLYYPGIVSYRDLSLASLPGPAPSMAELAYDQGDMEGARRAAAADLARDPADAQALAVLGWLALRENRPTEALEHFETALTTASPGQARLMLGLALARFRLGHVDLAQAFFRDSLGDMPVTPDLYAMAGFFSLMAGHPAQAESMLLRGLAIDPDNVLARSLLAQMRLVQNRKHEARQEAEAVLAGHPQSPLANLAAALTHLAFFELESARERLHTALSLDEDFLIASVYLARLHLGEERLDQAWETILPVLRKAPDEAEVLSMAGFIRLGFRDYDRAREFFDKAMQRDPGLGDPRMGLSLYWFARGDADRGVMQALAATLLDPRVSLYQSFLGKALFQARSFDKALELFDYAKDLDPADPTPYLYKGIVLTDLNRPGEAVQEFNRSIALNDNRAMFRSRLMLDRDLAVRNYDLARAYSQMGLNEWATSKALNAVKHDPSNPSAHHFLSLAESAKTIRERHGAAESEFLLYRLLSPANQNTFTYTNDYTPMFEAPYARVQLRTNAGAWKNSNTIHGYTLGGSGGRPGLAGLAFASRDKDHGSREPNAHSRDTVVWAMAKWEPSVAHSLLMQNAWYDNRSGDTFSFNDQSYVPSPYLEHEIQSRRTELGYVRRITPASTFLAYATHHVFEDIQSDHQWAPGDVPGFRETLDTRQEAKQENLNFQAQQRLSAGGHTILAGLNYLDGTEKYSWAERYAFLHNHVPLFEDQHVFDISSPIRSVNVYVYDYWKMFSNLVLEFSLSYDQVSREAIEEKKNLISPRFGLNWAIDQDNTVRLGFQRYLVTQGLDAQLHPAETAGFPGQRNAVATSRITESGAGWERQWNEKTFSVLRATTLQGKEPIHDRNSVDRYQGEAIINRIVTPVLGLNLSGLVKRVRPDHKAAMRAPEMDFLETRTTASLSLRHHSGLGLELLGIHVTQAFHDDKALDQKGNRREDSSFGLLNAKAFYEFPGKRGSVALEVNNILGSRFSYQPDSVSLDSLYPDRQVLLSLGVNF